MQKDRIFPSRKFDVKPHSEGKRLCSDPCDTDIMELIAASLYDNPCRLRSHLVALVRIIFCLIFVQLLGTQVIKTYRTDIRLWLVSQSLGLPRWVNSCI